MQGIKVNVLSFKGLGTPEASRVKEWCQQRRTRGMIIGKIIDNILHFIFSR